MDILKGGHSADIAHAGKWAVYFIAIGIIAGHILFFVLIAKYFPIFEHHPETVDYSLPDSFHKIDSGKPQQEQNALPKGKPASSIG